MKPLKRQGLGVLYLAVGLLVSLVGLGWGQEDSVSVQKGARAFSARHYAQAARHYRQALQQNPSNSQARLGLALVQKAQGKLKDSRETLEQLVARSPDFAPAYYDLGLVLEAQGELAAARESFRQYVLRSGGQIPPDPEIRLKLREMGVY